MKRLTALLVAVLLAVMVVPASAKKNKTKSQPSSTSTNKSKHARLSGRVVSATGHRAGHARVTLRKTGSRKRLHPRVNAAGHFSSKVKAGSYLVSASHRKLGSGHATASAAAGSTTSVTVHLSGKASHKHLHHHRHIHHHHRRVKAKVVSPGSTVSTGASGKLGAVPTPTQGAVK